MVVDAGEPPGLTFTRLVRAGLPDGRLLAGTGRGPQRGVVRVGPAR